MRRILFSTAAAVAIGCQQAPVTKPRILSVQTPAGMPPPPSLKTSRNAPLIVPTAPVGNRPGVVAPPVIMAPAPVPPPGAIAPPANAIQVPAVPGGVQGVAPQNTFAQPQQYQAPVQAYPPPAIGTTATMKEPEKLPGPVSSSRDVNNSGNRE
jgi:hypothetical protein